MLVEIQVQDLEDYVIVKRSDLNELRARIDSQVSEQRIAEIVCKALKAHIELHHQSITLVAA